LSEVLITFTLYQRKKPKSSKN